MMLLKATVLLFFVLLAKTDAGMDTSTVFLTCFIRRSVTRVRTQNNRPFVYLIG